MGCCPNLNVAPPSWRLNAGWKPALHLKLGQHRPWQKAGAALTTATDNLPNTFRYPSLGLLKLGRSSKFHFHTA